MDQKSWDALLGKREGVDQAARSVETKTVFGAVAAAFQSEHWEAAILICDELINLDASDSTAHLLRGVAFSKTDQYDKAINDFGEAIRLDPANANAHRCRGVVYMELNEYRNAIADYTEAIRLDPEDADAYRGRGFAFAKTGEPAKAVEDFNASVRINPDSALVYDGQESDAAKRGDYDKVMAEYGKSLRENPDEVKTYVLRTTATPGSNEGQVTEIIYESCNSDDTAYSSNRAGKRRESSGIMLFIVGLVAALITGFVFKGMIKNAILSSANPPAKIEFIVPVDFTGPMWIVEDRSNGTPLELVNRSYTIVIPDDGVVRVTSTQPLERASQTARCEDGTVLPFHSGASSASDVVALRHGGKMMKVGKDAARGLHFYYLGTGDQAKGFFGNPEPVPD